MSKPLHIILTGTPASGKRTQSSLIREKYGVAHLSVADLVKAAAAQGKDLGAGLFAGDLGEEVSGRGACFAAMCI
jgi:dephospho-CoA kinase